MVTFRDLGLNPMILQALTEIGFEKPTPIQSKAIPHLLSSEKDVVALAQTGTGKTAAFALPIVSQLDIKANNVQALILCPTRELAIQVAKEIDTFIKYLPNTSTLAVFGGANVTDQIRGLKSNPSIVVGTPGRVNDLIRRKALKVDQVKWLVLDEADEMLNMGFKEEIDETLETMPENKQVLLFSATMNKSVRRIASNYMRKPDDITVGTENQGADNVEHFYYLVKESDRYDALRRIADFQPDIHAIIFCRTRRETQMVADKLIKDGYSAEAIHGDIPQEQRLQAMNRFKDRKIQMLVATDVAARGIDVDKLSHVINYNLPESTEAYVHRSGRTGRAHNSGVSFLIINLRERHKIKDLERKIKKPFEQAKVPSGADICEKQLFSLIDNVSKVEVDEDKIEKYLGAISVKLKDFSREELIKKFVSVEFNRFIKHYHNAKDLNPNEKSLNEMSTSNRGSFTRFNFNLGMNQGLEVKDIFEFINESKKLKGVEIGKISINQNDTSIEIDQDRKDDFVEYFSTAEVDGKLLDIEIEEENIPMPDNSRKRGNSRGGGRNRGRGRGNNYGGGRRDDGGRSGGNRGRSSYGGNRRSNDGEERRGGGRSGGDRGRNSYGGNRRGGSGGERRGGSERRGGNNGGYRGSGGGRRSR